MKTTANKNAKKEDETRGDKRASCTFLFTWSLTAIRGESGGRVKVQAETLRAFTDPSRESPVGERRRARASAVARVVGA